MQKKEKIGDILQNELNKRNSLTDMPLLAKEIFERDKAAAWMKKVLECDAISELDQRIDESTPERLSHAISTYLLGCAIRENLELNFDFLPRLLSHGVGGDAFYFFWSVVCLCHDLGYQYEADCYELDKMNTHEDRCSLLKIEFDLFELKKEKLEEFGVETGSEEERWILDTLDMAKKYDERRRKTRERDKDHAVIDHGIAGALILYDILIKHYERVFAGKKEILSPEKRWNPAESAEQPVYAGELLANASNKRFAACGIIIACTVARHNMWIAATPEDIRLYRRYGLDSLCSDREEVYVSIEKRMEHLLFMLAYMDTIDPIKGIYTRAAERGDATPEKMADNLELLLNKVYFTFEGSYQEQYRWRRALSYRKFVISVDETETDENKALFSDYGERIEGIDGWLKTKPPFFQKDGGRRISGITCYYPTLPRKGRFWAGGITEQEVTALCVYEGCGGSGKADLFYQYPNAYQTFNLLMMESLEGERIRICEEKQNPYGLYIRKWEKTLEVITDIFTAQCKFMEFQAKTDHSKYHVYRADRRVNFDMMIKNKRTYAFTSTSKRCFLKKIAQSKKELVLLDIIIDGKIPFIDYAELLKEEYVYSDEQELLLPPFLKMNSFKEVALTEDEQNAFGMSESVHKYLVDFSRVEIQDKAADEMALIEWLDKNKDKAGDVLDQMRENRVFEQENEDVQIYLKWKQHFQQLVSHCIFNIGKAYQL